MMKLSAPEMASEPYTAEAPPVMMSRRSTSGVGMIEVSTMPSVLYGVRRLPSIRIRLRCEPRPRRLIVEAPAVPLLTLPLSPGEADGRIRTTRSTEGVCRRVMSCELTLVIGLADSIPGSVMRVPVTTTCSISVSCALAATP